MKKIDRSKQAERFSMRFRATPEEVSALREFLRVQMHEARLKRAEELRDVREQLRQGRRRADD